MIAPADDLVAFLRPRVRLEPDVWARLPLAQTAEGDGRPNPFRARALTEHNPHVDLILCSCTSQPSPDFRPLPGLDS